MLDKLKDEIKLHSEELKAKEETIRRLANDKVLLEQTISGLEKIKGDEVTHLKHEFGETLFSFSNFAFLLFLVHGRERYPQ